MSKNDYDILFDYIYNSIENEECAIYDILKRNIKKKIFTTSIIFKFIR